eukprot:GHVQ01023481.1.p2 GENE.GHVQ01023481.1~~GHVQ01023481.1.p2  ORF type:complete len:633 (+),score=40.19 GHVQ01023481.1:2217-4115(+)
MAITALRAAGRLLCIVSLWNLINLICRKEQDISISMVGCAGQTAPHYTEPTNEKKQEPVEEARGENFVEMVRPILGGIYQSSGAKAEEGSSTSSFEGDQGDKLMALTRMVPGIVRGIMQRYNEGGENPLSVLSSIFSSFAAPAEEANTSGAVVNRRSLREVTSVVRRLEPTGVEEELPLPALPIKLSIGSWLPDPVLFSEDAKSEVPYLVYQIIIAFIQNSVLIDPGAIGEVLPPPTGPFQTTSETLTDIKIVGDKGLGNENNRYVFDMVSYKGKLYASTLNFSSREGVELFFLGLPFASDGAEIYRGEQPGGPGSDWSWTNVVKNGLGSSTNGGVRNLVVFEDYIFAVTLNHYLGFELWRSCDGENWTAAVRLGFGNRFNTSGRGLAVYKGYLYIGVENRSTGAQLWRRKLASDGDWAEGHAWQVIDHGNGVGSLLTNFWYSDLIEFNGSLYVGTMNFLGLEIWKLTDNANTSETDVSFTKVYKGEPDVQGRGVAKMIVLNESTLLVGTMFRTLGAVLLSSTDGENFQTHFPPTKVNESGEKVFIYLWSMVEYNNRVYVAGIEWISQKKGFVLFSFDDPNSEWTVETSDAFAYEPLYYGLRSMIVHNNQLLMGSAGTEPVVIFSANAKPIT